MPSYNIDSGSGENGCWYVDKERDDGILIKDCVQRSIVCMVIRRIFEVLWKPHFNGDTPEITIHKELIIQTQKVHTKKFNTYAYPSVKNRMFNCTVKHKHLLLYILTVLRNICIINCKLWPICQ